MRAAYARTVRLHEETNLQWGIHIQVLAFKGQAMVDRNSFVICGQKHKVCTRFLS